MWVDEEAVISESDEALNILSERNVCQNKLLTQILNT